MGIAETIHRLTEAKYLVVERAAQANSEFFGRDMFTNVTFSPAPIREQIRRPA